MNTIALDIETGPLPDTSARIRDLYPFDPSTVKCGNLGPDKAAEKVAQAEVEHYAKLEDRALLDPFLSRVVAVGILDESETTDELMAMMAAQDEKQMLLFAWDRMSETSVQIVGWNLHGFDLPYIVRRSWVLGVHVPSWVRRGRYWSDRTTDLMEAFRFYDRTQPYTSLTNAARLLGVAQPREHGVQGKDFWRVLETDPERAHAYLHDDLIETQAIADIIL